MTRHSLRCDECQGNALASSRTRKYRGCQPKHRLQHTAPRHGTRSRSAWAWSTTRQATASVSNSSCHPLFYAQCVHAWREPTHVVIINEFLRDDPRRVFHHFIDPLAASQALIPGSTQTAGHPKPTQQVQHKQVQPIGSSCHVCDVGEGGASLPAVTTHRSTSRITVLPLSECVSSSLQQPTMRYTLGNSFLACSSACGRAHRRGGTTHINHLSSTLPPSTRTRPQPCTAPHLPWHDHNGTYQRCHRRRCGWAYRHGGE